MTRPVDLYCRTREIRVGGEVEKIGLKDARSIAQLELLTPDRNYGGLSRFLWRIGLYANRVLRNFEAALSELTVRNRPY